jgi:hypothetical protein
LQKKQKPGDFDGDEKLIIVKGIAVDVRTQVIKILLE